MLGLDVFSEGKHFMDLMHLPRRSPLAKPATVCQNGVVALKSNAGKISDFLQIICCVLEFN